MLVMVSNINGTSVGIIAERYRGSLGHLYSPGAQRGPWPELPYALDNGAYVAWQKNLDFPEDAWRRLLDWSAATGQAPLWSLVPDQVADRSAIAARAASSISRPRKASANLGLRTTRNCPQAPATPTRWSTTSA